MTNQINGDKLFVIDPHPVMPPFDQLKKWEDEWFDEEEHADVLLIQAFQAGADQELEACLRLVEIDAGEDAYDFARYIRAARRPNPPSLKEQALEMLENAWEGGHINNNAAQTIRRALEQLHD